MSTSKDVLHERIWELEEEIERLKTALLAKERINPSVWEMPPQGIASGLAMQGKWSGLYGVDVRSDCCHSMVWNGTMSQFAQGTCFKCEEVNGSHTDSGYLTQDYSLKRMQTIKQE